MGFHPGRDDTVQMWQSKGEDLPCVRCSQELGGRLPMAAAAGKIEICIGFNSLWCLRDATKICIFLLCTVTARKIKATPTGINSIIIHAADRDTGPQRCLLRAVESGQGCQPVPEAGPGPRPPPQRRDVVLEDAASGLSWALSSSSGTWQAMKW